MKRRIAAFANGWSDDYLKIALQGVKQCALDNNTDVYLFLDYASFGQNDEDKQGEINIINLAKLEDYDGVLLFGNTLNNAGELDIILEKIAQIDIPAVCLEYEADGVDCICTDNYTGMYELCCHVLDEHKAQDIMYISGIPENKENLERLRALKDALAERNLSLKDDNILNGEWSYYSVQEKLPDWLRTHKLPDAIICANDVMAMGAIAALGNFGYVVPDDILVTGFDNIETGRVFIPMLTTVDRGWDERSYIGMKHLIDLMDGAERTGITKLESHLKVGESCGCTLPDDMKKKRVRSYNLEFSVPVERTLFDWHLTGIDEACVSGKNLEETHDGLARFFEGSKYMYEGDTFCICLDDKFTDSFNKSVEPRRLGYGTQMYVLYATRSGHVLPFQKIRTSYIFPVFEAAGEKANMYLIAPVHNHSVCLGYVVFKNKHGMLETYFLYSWLRHLRSGLIRAKQSIMMENMNRRLSEISFMDELSGLYNRKGYEKRGIPLLEKLKAENKSGVMMMVDINRMKQINDKYGHLQGDLAIRIVAKAIKSVIPKGWFGIRYGGDEFVVLGEKVFLDDGKMIQEQLCNSVIMEAETMALPFSLTVSVGTVIIDPKYDISMDEFFKLADNAMYEMKKKAHEKD